jgi:endonuclease/exonuclease/phosphatase family metal-dependent hydrolase
VASEPLRVLTYNVRGLRDDIPALVRVVRATDPDVVCLQEAPRRLRWRPRIAALARACGLSYVGGGGTTGGSALLAQLRVDVDRVQEQRLTQTRGLHQRGVVVARVRRAGPVEGAVREDLDLDVASVHFGLDAGERLAHAGEVLGLLTARAPRRLALGCDLNEAPGGPTWTRLAAGGLTDAGRGGDLTFSSRNPRQRIDAVLTGRGLEVLRVGVPTDLVQAADLTAASDHRPVLAVVRPVPVCATFMAV